MKKTLICLMLVVATLLSLGTVAFAQEEQVSVFLDGVLLEFDQNPVIQNGRTLVPLRGIFEPMGATVEWEDATRTVTAVKDDITIKLTIGDNILYKNGEAITLDVPAQLIGSRTMVPARAVSEAFDARVGWIEELWVVTIVTDETMKKAIDRVNNSEEIAMEIGMTFTTDVGDVTVFMLQGQHMSKGIKYKNISGYLLPSDYEEMDLLSIQVTDGTKTYVNENGEGSYMEGVPEDLLNISTFEDVMNSLTVAVKTYENYYLAVYDDGMGTAIIIEKETGDISFEIDAAEAGLEGQITEKTIYADLFLDPGFAERLQDEYLK